MFWNHSKYEVVVKTESAFEANILHLTFFLKQFFFDIFFKAKSKSNMNIAEEIKTKNITKSKIKRSVLMFQELQHLTVLLRPGLTTQLRGFKI